MTRTVAVPAFLRLAPLHILLRDPPLSLRDHQPDVAHLLQLLEAVERRIEPRRCLRSIFLRVIIPRLAPSALYYHLTTNSASAFVFSLKSKTAPRRLGAMRERRSSSAMRPVCQRMVT